MTRRKNPITGKYEEGVLRTAKALFVKVGYVNLTELEKGIQFKEVKFTGRLSKDSPLVASNAELLQKVQFASNTDTEKIAYIVEVIERKQKEWVPIESWDAVKIVIPDDEDTIDDEEG